MRTHVNPRFAIGDRVQVIASWSDCHGMIGTVEQPPTDWPDVSTWTGHIRKDTISTGKSIVYWIRFNPKEWKAGVVEGGEFPEEALEIA